MVGFERARLQRCRKWGKMSMALAAKGRFSSDFDFCRRLFVWAKRLEDERGSALVELAFCVPMMLVLIFGLIEFSQIIYAHEVMAGISRQGSSIVSRDDNSSDIPGTLAALVTQGGALNLGTNGKIIVSEVNYPSSTCTGTLSITQYTSVGGIAATSVTNNWVANPDTIPLNAQADLNACYTLVITEVFYTYHPITPIGGLLKMSLTPTLYDAAYF